MLNRTVLSIVGVILAIICVLSPIGSLLAQEVAPAAAVAVAPAGGNFLNSLFAILPFFLAIYGPQVSQVVNDHIVKIPNKAVAGLASAVFGGAFSALATYGAAQTGMLPGADPTAASAMGLLFGGGAHLVKQSRAIGAAPAVKA